MSAAIATSIVPLVRRVARHLGRQWLDRKIFPTRIPYILPYEESLLDAAVHRGYEMTDAVVQIITGHTIDNFLDDVGSMKLLFSHMCKISDSATFISSMRKMLPRRDFDDYFLSWIRYTDNRDAVAHIMEWVRDGDLVCDIFNYFICYGPESTCAMILTS